MNTGHEAAASWPVRIYTLGRFGLVVNGEPVRSSGKAQKKPLGLLKAMIALGGRNVSEQQLCAVLWPDARSDAAHLLFKTTLHRLRRLIACAPAVTCHEGSASLDGSCCWTDVWAFERLLGQAKKAWKDTTENAEPASRSDGDAARLTQQALDLYQGHFLASDCNEAWVVSLREHLRCMYVRAVVRLGAHWENTRAIDRAVTCYEDGLRTDDLEEEFYQRLIACHARAGRNAAAIRTFQRCRSVLAAGLGAEPSPETLALSRTIRQ